MSEHPNRRNSDNNPIEKAANNAVVKLASQVAVVIVCGVVVWFINRFAETSDTTVEKLQDVALTVERIQVQVEANRGWLRGHENRIQYLERTRRESKAEPRVTAQ